MSNQKSIAAALTIAFSLALQLQAAPVQKANNANLLNDPNSWVSLVLPGSGDIATWDSTVTAANSVGLGASTTWAGIALVAPGGLVTITNDGNSLTLGANGIDLSVTNNGLTLNCPLNISANQIWAVTNSRTVTVNSSVNDSGSGFGITKNGNGGVTLAGTNSFSGPIVLNAGTLTLANSNAWPGAASLSFKGGTLAINAGVIVTNLSIVTSNTTAAANVSCSGILPNNITINPGTNNIPPTASGIYTVPASGFVQVNLSGSVAAGGFITNYGVLNLSGGGVQNIGTIIGAGNEAAGTLGGIQDNNTNAAGKTLTFGNGSAFSYFKPGAASRSTLQVAGNGSVYFKWFGYNDTAGMVPYTNTLNGGNWIFGQMGQNNSGTHYIGQLNITGGASVTVTNQNSGSGPGPAYSHGTYNIINGSMTFYNTVAEGHAANNFPLNFYANNSGGGAGVLNITNGGLSLGFSATFLNTAPENNSLNVGTGGAANLTGNLTVGTTQAQSNPETNAVNLSGGKLVVSGTVQAATTASGQDRSFNWTGGQLSAFTITPSAGFNDSASFITTTTISNTAGILAPGDDGIPGKTTINGSYAQSGSAVVAIDIGGTNRASTFQTNVVGNYDYLAIGNSGTVTLGGSCKVSLVGGFTPLATDQFNIITATSFSGNFTNLTAGGNLGRVAVANMANASFSIRTNSLNNTIYLIDYQVASTIANYSTNIIATVINGGTELNISWPATHLGWTLQAQTNSLSVGLTTNGWVDVSGTASVTSTNLPIVPANPAVFYRLRN